MARLTGSLRQLAALLFVLWPAAALAQDPNAVVRELTPLRLYPNANVRPVLMIEGGVYVFVIRDEGDWSIINVEDSRGDLRAGYVETRLLQRLTSPWIPPTTQTDNQQAKAQQPANAGRAKPQQPLHAQPTAGPADPSISHVPTPGARPETIEGYLEWLRDDHIIVDGQRVYWNPATRLRLGHSRTVTRVPLGSEMKIKGTRDSDGALIAQEIEAKPNGTALFETDVISVHNVLEQQWVGAGQAFEPQKTGTRIDLGRIIDTGPAVDRVRAIMNRLVPSYVNPGALRVRVVENDAWNARAMGNGAIWVHTALLNDVNDDELAVVLGHELAHYTHEHPRRGQKRSVWGQLIRAGAGAALSTVRNDTAREMTALAATLSLSAWTSGYSRELEDQADRVGLRYAYEAGYDVFAAPTVWARVRDRQGESDRFMSFFLDTHSRPTERIRNLQIEIARNYRQQE